MFNVISLFLVLFICAMLGYMVWFFVWSTVTIYLESWQKKNNKK